MAISDESIELLGNGIRRPGADGRRFASSYESPRTGTCLKLLVVLFILQVFLILNYNTPHINAMLSRGLWFDPLDYSENTALTYPIPARKVAPVPQDKSTLIHNGLLQNITKHNDLQSSSKVHSSMPSPESLKYPIIPRSDLESCPETPPHLVGRLKIDFFGTYADYKNFPASLDELDNAFSHSNNFAVFSPANETTAPCHPPHTKSKVAIIICYRERERQLRFFLMYMLPVFQRQQLEFKIYVVEQKQGGIFNRAKLLNVGYDLAKNDPAGVKWDCYTFHDVDIILENDKMLYRCNADGDPRHLSVAINTMNYKLPYVKIFGGITQIEGAKYEHVNGYPNAYWGWGGEDDDMYTRMFIYGKYKLNRPPKELARYKMIKHEHEASNKLNPRRFTLLRSALKNRPKDGIAQLKYKIIGRLVRKTFEKITVDIDAPDDIPRG